MKLVRSYIGDQRPSLAETKFLADSIVHTQSTLTVVTDPNDEDWDAGTYTLETIIGILSGAVAAVTGTPPSDLSARAGAANDQHAKADGGEADGEAIDFTYSLHLHHRLAGAICAALMLEKNVPQCVVQLRLGVGDCSARQNLSWIFEPKRVPMQALLFVHLVLHLENELAANTHKAVPRPEKPSRDGSLAQLYSSVLLAAGDSAAAQEAWLQSEMSAFDEQEGFEEDEGVEDEDAPQLEPHSTGKQHEAAGAAINGGEGGAPVAKPTRRFFSSGLD
jgi:hypothetical protein